VRRGEPEGNGGLLVRVNNGTAEVQTTIESWPWCSLASAEPIATCLIGAGRKAGAFLDLEFDVATRAEALVVADEAILVSFDIGAGAEFVMSKRASVGGTYAAVADGYPMVMSSTATNLRVVVRIPRPAAGASATIKYDPFLGPSGGGVVSGSAVVRGDTSVAVATSGTVTISSVTNARTAVNVQLQSADEVDASGAVVSGTGGAHLLAAATSGGLSLGIGPVRTTSSLSVSAGFRTVSGTFLGRASVDQDVMVFGGEGVISPEGSGGFSAAVRNGTVKTTTRISTWPWCCDSAFLDLRFALGTRSSAFKQAGGTSSRTFSMGGGASAQFSRRVRVGGTWQAVVGDYPKLDEAATTNTQAVVVVRVARPADPTAETFYDPVVNDAGASSSAGGPAVTMAATATALALLLASATGH